MFPSVLVVRSADFFQSKLLVEASCESFDHTELVDTPMASLQSKTGLQELGKRDGATSVDKTRSVFPLRERDHRGQENTRDPPRLDGASK